VKSTKKVNALFVNITLIFEIAFFYKTRDILIMRLKIYVIIKSLIAFCIMMCIFFLFGYNLSLKILIIEINSTTRKLEMNKNKQLPKIPRMKEMEMKYLKSNEMISKACTETQEPNRTLINRDFMNVDFHHKLAACLHDKVGSTTLSNYFYALLPNQTRIELEKRFGKRLFKQEIIKPYFRLPKGSFFNMTDDLISIQQINEVLEKRQILTFSFVRHPFERVVSAYHDRILHNKNILREYGYSTLYHKNHSFPAFVDLILSEYNSSNCFRFNDIGCLKIDRHWIPFSAKCPYCNLKFDVIGRMSTFNEDVQYIIKKSHLESIIPLSRITKVMHSSNVDMKQKTKLFFAQLTRNKVKELYKMYETDFRMFGYDAKPYFPSI